MSPITQCRARRGSRRILLAAVLTAAGLAIGGCAAFKPKTPEQAVTERAQDRWDAMRSGNFQKSYDLTAPSFRAVKTFAAFRDSFGSGDLWLSAKVMEVKCASESTCIAVVEVAVRNTTPIPKPPVLTTALREDWIKQDGAWYLLPNL